MLTIAMHHVTFYFCPTFSLLSSIRTAHLESFEEGCFQLCCVCVAFQNPLISILYSASQCCRSYWSKRWECHPYVQHETLFTSSSLLPWKPDRRSPQTEKGSVPVQGFPPSATGGLIMIKLCTGTSLHIPKRVARVHCLQLHGIITS
jgi:hypothetical protein